MASLDSPVICQGRTGFSMHTLLDTLDLPFDRTFNPRTCPLTGWPLDPALVVSIVVPFSLLLSSLGAEASGSDRVNRAISRRPSSHRSEHASMHTPGPAHTEGVSVSAASLVTSGPASTATRKDGHILTGCIMFCILAQVNRRGQVNYRHETFELLELQTHADCHSPLREAAA